MAVRYEWDIETVTDVETDDHEVDEVLEHHHCESYHEVKGLLTAWSAPGPGLRYDVVIVRDDDEGRSWCSLDDGKLDDAFYDANGGRVAKVPKRFIDEVARNA